MDLPTLKSRYIKDMPPPRELVCPDKRVDLGWWIDILVGVAEWLIDKGYIRKSHCPVPIGRHNAILNTIPFHQNGKQFPTYKEIGNFFLNKQINPLPGIRYTIKIIKIAGLEPSDFKVYFGNSNHTDPRLP